MQLYMPTKVYSEEACVVNHGRELAALGTKAMIVTGRHSAAKCGALADVLQALGSTPYILFDRVEENPSVETVMEARTIAIAEDVNFFIGIGGGSPMDAAKAISLMAFNPEKGEEVLYAPETLGYFPVACVPTTCGTGSEVTPYAILTRHAHQTKKSISHKIYPRLALLDAKYLRSMSRSGLVNTCVDALCHLLESYLNTNTNDLNRIYSREGLQIWGQFKDRLLDNTLADTDYTLMLHASMIAGIAITHTGTSLPHGMSYPVTYRLGIPHGRACGIFLGGYVANYPDQKDATAAAGLLGFETTLLFRDYLQQLLGETPIPEALLQTAAESLLADPGKLKNYPFSITEAELLALTK